VKEKKVNPFTTVTPLSKLVALTLFVSLPFIGAYVGIRFQKSVTVQPVVINKSCEQCVPQNNTKKPAEEPRLIMEKKVAGGRIAAYRPTGNAADDVFYIALEVGKYIPEIYSSASSTFSEDGLFAIVNSKLFVVNGQTNKIDVYNIMPEGVSEEDYNFSSLGYLESIDLPRYRLGTLYRLECVTQDCLVSTAFHLEAGCGMNLNVNTKEFSNIQCGGMGGEIIPERY
jgi:hypothetical protein